MTPTQRETAEKLIEALEGQFIIAAAPHAAALLRELLAEPVQEPVAYIHQWKPHANVIGRSLHWLATSPHGDDVEVTPLFAAPQQRKPLTDAKARDLARRITGDVYGQSLLGDQVIAFARAIERAHGIKEAP